MKLSLVIPAHNEEDSIKQVVLDVVSELEKEGISYEIVVVNDNSTDNTQKIVEGLATGNLNVRILNRRPPCGFGRAIRDGLDNAAGDVVGIVMGDLSDAPKDITRCFRKIEEGYDCVFGSRFIKGAKVNDYPLLKLIINRIANTFIRVLFLTKANDITNAFKFYKASVIKAVLPLHALYFNATVEVPLKALVRGFSYVQIPISWYGRKSGVSKLGIRQMGRKYLFTVLYVWLEKILLKDEIRNKGK